MNAPSEADLAFASIVEVARRMRVGEVTSKQLTVLMLDRIERLNPSLNCYLTVCRDSALEQAEGLDRLLANGVDLGALHGIPVGIKDNMATAGVRTTGGSRILKDWFPETDAAVVRKTKEAGGVILGKLALYEFAFGGWHDDFGLETRNPWDTSRSCSASSNGPGLRGGCRSCLCQPRQRYRRIGPASGRCVRPCRDETDLRPSQPRGRAARPATASIMSVPSAAPSLMSRHTLRPSPAPRIAIPPARGARPRAIAPTWSAVSGACALACPRCSQAN